METTTATLIGIVTTVGGILFFLFGIQMNMVNEVSRRLRNYVEEPQGKQNPLPLTAETRKAELTGTFRSRVLGPWIARITDFLGRLTPGRLSSAMENDLTMAGNPLGLSPRGFYFIRMGSTLIGFLLAFIMVQGAFAPEPTLIGGMPCLRSVYIHYFTEDLAAQKSAQTENGDNKSNARCIGYVDSLCGCWAGF